MPGINNFNLNYRADGSGKHVYFQLLTFTGTKTIVRVNPDTSSAKVVVDLPEDLTDISNGAQPGETSPKPSAKSPEKKKDCGCSKKKKETSVPKTTLLDKAKGAVKLAKAELGVDDVSLEVLTERRTICNTCDKNDFGRCQECGCYLWAKTRLKSEKCPIGSW